MTVTQHEQTRHLRTDRSIENDVRNAIERATVNDVGNAIERATVSANRIDILLSNHNGVSARR